VALLEVNDLSVTFSTPDGLLNAVRGISFTVEAGKTLGIVGESGSGKSVSTQSVVGLTTNARITGQALFEGRDLLTMRRADLQKVRGAEIGMIFQDPLSSLHPYYRVGWQIIEMIRAHEDVNKSDARKRAIDLLRLVGIPQPDSRVDNFPHEFSGGMRQRAMIAMAMALNPKLLIADEPTTALDVTVQAQVIEVMRRLQADFGTAIIMITHDLGVIADMADEVIVMYAGSVAERADRRTAFYSPHHPYTKGLLDSLPVMGASTERLKPIPGQPPSLLGLPPGCPFQTRCTYVMEQCLTEMPPLRPASGGVGHLSACWLPPDAVGQDEEAEARRKATAKKSRGARAKSQAAKVEEQMS
jgi:oligopeptide/dipeptide ABC transporter ATP-binding protein